MTVHRECCYFQLFQLGTGTFALPYSWFPRTWRWWNYEGIKSRPEYGVSVDTTPPHLHLFDLHSKRIAGEYAILMLKFKVRIHGERKVHKKKRLSSIYARLTRFRIAPWIFSMYLAIESPQYTFYPEWLLSMWSPVQSESVLSMWFDQLSSFSL